MGGPSLSSLTWPIFATVAHPDSSAQAAHSFVSKQARWVEREEVREQQVDACNSLRAPCPVLTQPSPTAGPLTVAVRLGALRQCGGITDTWQPFDKAAPLKKHLELNGPGLRGWAGTLSSSPYRTDEVTRATNLKANRAGTRSIIFQLVSTT